MPTVEPEMSTFFTKFMEWADEERTLGVRANADTPHDAKVAREFGAEGIGLCRTEHMFFGAGADRCGARNDPGARTPSSARSALAKILPMQRDDFVGILQEMAGLPVTIRLLDPPLHEFLPKEDDEIRELAQKIGIDPGASEAGAREPVRVQPDARPSRLAPRHQLSGNLQGAGARDHRGGVSTARRRA